MPKITLNKNEVLKLMGKTVSDKELESSIPLLGTDLESVTKDTIEVEIFPNRPDMLSEEGFARALSSFLEIKTGLREYKVNNSDYKVNIDKTSKEIVPFVAAAVVKGLNFTEASLKSLMNLQEKLHTTHGRNRKRLATGAYDLSKIKFPLALTIKPRSFRFHALDDTKERTIDDILKNHPKGKDYSHLVQKNAVVWIDANNNVLSMPPVINSDPTKVTEKTKDIFIEVTGSNKEAVEKALTIQLAALADRGGKIYKVNSWPEMNPEKIKVSLNNINKLLGINLSSAEFSKLASKMGLELKKDIVYYPAYRADILHEVDIAEDIAIAYGYQNFIPEIPKMATIGQEDAFEKFKNKIAALCVGLSLQEVCSYNLSNKADEISKMKKDMDIIKIKNSLSQEYNILRPGIIPSLLRILSSNKHNEYPQNIFEIGKVFVKKGKEVEEPAILGIALCDSTTDYTEAKKILDAIFVSLGMAIYYAPQEHSSYISGRAAKVASKGKNIACLGEVHPEVLNNFNLDLPVAVIELNLTELFSILSNEK